MNKFVNREKELALLKKMYNNKQLCVFILMKVGSMDILGGVLFFHKIIDRQIPP